MAKDDPDLKDSIEKVRLVATDPEFTRLLQEIQDCPLEEREAFLRRAATPQALVKRGIPVPEDVKVTTRYFFEDYKNEGAMVLPTPSRSEGRPETMTGCACVGAATVCVGVGW